MKTSLLFNLFLLQVLIGFNPLNAQKVDTNKLSSFITFENNLHQKSASTFSNENPLEVLKRYLPVKANDDFRLYKSFTDELGHKHYKYQQYYKGIKVSFATYNVHYKNGNLHVINGDYQVISDMNTIPALSERRALDYALKYVNAKQYKWEDINSKLSLPKGELVIINSSLDKNTSKLAYKFDIDAISPNNSLYIYVDAHSGKIIKEVSKNQYSLAKKNTPNKEDSLAFDGFSYNNQEAPSSLRTTEGQGETAFYGLRSFNVERINDNGPDHGKYKLKDSRRGFETFPVGGGIVFFHSESPYFNKTDLFSKTAIGTHWALGKAYDYFSQKHNWIGYDNNPNSSLILSVQSNSQTYPSSDWAYYSPSSDLIEFNYYRDTEFSLASLDIVGHELAHAVVIHAVDDTNLNLNGSLAEGLADIFGIATYKSVFPNKNPWIIGSDAISGGIRNIAIPKTKTFKDFVGADTYRGINWNKGAYAQSTVLSHWFYILSQGKSGTNDQGTRYNVSGIGIDKAAKIAFRAVKTYMTTNMSFASINEHMLQAAKDLYSSNSNEVNQVKEAWKAVGLPLTKSCSSNAIDRFPYFYSFETNAWSGSWFYRNSFPSSEDPYEPSAPSNGNIYIKSQNNINVENDILNAIPLELPSDTNFQIQFDYYINGDSESTRSPKYNILKLQVSTNNGNSWETISQIVKSSGTPRWRTKTISLSRYGGNCLQLRFVNHNPNRTGMLSGTMALDNVHIMSSNVSKSNNNVNGDDIVKIFPNPAHNQLNIQLPVASNKNIHLYTIVSVKGAKVLNGKSDQKTLEIDMSQFSKGVYFIRVQNNSESYIKKFIKI